MSLKTLIHLLTLFLQADVLKATLATDAVIGSTVRAVISSIKMHLSKKYFQDKICMDFFALLWESVSDVYSTNILLGFSNKKLNRQCFIVHLIFLNL
jgi:hypothetical protein